MFSFLFVYFGVKSLIFHIFLIIMIIIPCSGMVRVSPDAQTYFQFVGLRNLLEVNSTPRRVTRFTDTVIKYVKLRIQAKS